MERASAFVPGHISGFFQICNRSKELARRGSRNCGICIDNGVLTSIEAKMGTSSDIDILINGEKKPAKTTRSAIKNVLENFEREASVRVEHSVQAPMGAGYGMSGAGTLGAVLALSKALDLDIDRNKALRIAHKAEVECKSGLGDVGPEMDGGIVIGLEPGAPPYGKLERIETEENLKVICGTLGSFSTSTFLDDEDFSERSRKLGGEAMRILLREKSVENFMRASKNFTLELGVFDEDFIEVMKGISSNSPYGASAVMLGRAVFAPASPAQAESLESTFLEYFDSEEIMKTSVDFEGAKVLV